MLFRIACTASITLLCLPTSTVVASDVVDLAARLIGRPYVWGAEGPRSFDCSGLTQYVFGEFGVDLPRRAVQQSKVGDPTGRRLRRGDLVFFASDAERSLVTHVGIYEGNGQMVNASQRHRQVRRDDLDDPYWTTRFMFARRVMGEIDSREARDDSAPVARTERREPSRRGARRVLGRIAEELLRRYPR